MLQSRNLTVRQPGFHCLFLISPVHRTASSTDRWDRTKQTYVPDDTVRIEVEFDQEDPPTPEP